MLPYNLYAITNGHDARRASLGHWSKIRNRPMWLCSVGTAEQLAAFKSGLLIGSGAFDHSGWFHFISEEEFKQAEEAALSNLRRSLPAECHPHLRPATPNYEA